VNKKYTVKFGPLLNTSEEGANFPPFNTSQASFILESAFQCDVVPEVPDFSCFNGTADVPTPSGNRAMSIQVSLRAPNLVGGGGGGSVQMPEVVHRFSGICENGLIVGKWRYFKPHRPRMILLQEATFEMQQSGN
jgi:hypothetical protein